MGEVCGDNRFEIIQRAKDDLINSTNIKTSLKEMEVLDNFLFRCWQMGWLKQYNENKYKGFNMEDYIDAIESYKNKACEIINSNCEKCEARQEYNGNYYCCFDTTIRFIKYANNNLIK